MAINRTHGPAVLVRGIPDSVNVGADRVIVRVLGDARGRTGLPNRGSDCASQPETGQITSLGSSRRLAPARPGP